MFKSSVRLSFKILTLASLMACTVATPTGVPPLATIAGQPTALVTNTRFTVAPIASGPIAPTSTPLALRRGPTRNDFLAGIPCSPPCWEHIQIGKTSLNELDRIWNDYDKQGPLITRELTHPFGGVGAGEVQLNWRDLTTKDGAIIYFRLAQDYAKQTIFYVVVPFEYTPSEIFDAFGEPSSVRTKQYLCGAPQGPAPLCRSITYIFPDRSMEFILSAINQSITQTFEMSVTHGRVRLIGMPSELELENVRGYSQKETVLYKRGATFIDYCANEFCMWSR